MMFLLVVRVQPMATTVAATLNLSSLAAAAAAAAAAVAATRMFGL